MGLLARWFRRAAKNVEPIAATTTPKPTSDSMDAKATTVRYTVAHQCRYLVEADGNTRGDAMLRAYNEIKREAPGLEIGRVRILIDPQENANTLLATFELESVSAAKEFSTTVKKILQNHGFEYAQETAEDNLEKAGDKLTGKEPPEAGTEASAVAAAQRESRYVVRVVSTLYGAKYPDPKTGKLASHPNDLQAWFASEELAGRIAKRINESADIEGTAEVVPLDQAVLDHQKRS
jgi:hypothetical protein